MSVPSSVTVTSPPPERSSLVPPMGWKSRSTALSGPLAVKPYRRTRTPAASARSASAAEPGSSAQAMSTPPGSSLPTKSSNTRTYAASVPWWSRWSASTLVTMATDGENTRNEPSLSSASATNMPPLPWCALAPDSLRSPPIANDGSR